MIRHGKNELKTFLDTKFKEYQEMLKKIESKYTKSLRMYNNKMEKSLKDDGPCYMETSFNELHASSKSDAIRNFYSV